MSRTSDGTPEIPDKLFFRIGEVARLTSLKPYVLRYWETEFSMLRPKKSSSGQRLYRRKDVETVFSIRSLLRERKFTIAGARAELLRARRAGEPLVQSSSRLDEDDELDTVRLDDSSQSESTAALVQAAADAVDQQSELLSSIQDQLIEMKTELKAFVSRR